MKRRRLGWGILFWESWIAVDPSNEETQFLDQNDMPKGGDQPPIGPDEASSTPATQGLDGEFAADGRPSEWPADSNSLGHDSDSSPHARAARHYPKIDGYRIL